MAQRPMDGTSLLYSFDDAEAEERHRWGPEEVRQRRLREDPSVDPVDRRSGLLPLLPLLVSTTTAATVPAGPRARRRCSGVAACLSRGAFSLPLRCRPRRSPPRLARAEPSSHLLLRTARRWGWGRGRRDERPAPARAAADPCSAQQQSTRAQHRCRPAACRFATDRVERVEGRQNLPAHARIGPRSQGLTFRAARSPRAPSAPSPYRPPAAPRPRRRAG